MEWTEVREGGGWRQGSESMPVWVATSVARGRVELSRWLPEEHGVRRETLDLRVESLLHGDSGWRPADPGEAEEQLARAQEMYAAAADALVERRRVSTSPSAIADMAARALEVSRYAKPDPEDVARVREQIARAARIPHVDYLGKPTSAEALGEQAEREALALGDTPETAAFKRRVVAEHVAHNPLPQGGPPVFTTRRVSAVESIKGPPRCTAHEGEYVCGLEPEHMGPHQDAATGHVFEGEAAGQARMVREMQAGLDEARERLRLPEGVLVGGGPGPRSVPEVLRALQDVRRFLIGQGAVVIGLVEAAEGHLSELHGPAFDAWRCDECTKVLTHEMAMRAAIARPEPRQLFAALAQVRLVSKPGSALEYVECCTGGDEHGPMRRVQCRVTANG